MSLTAASRRFGDAGRNEPGGTPPASGAATSSSVAASRLPELARNLGRGLAEFRRASWDLRRSVMDTADEVRRPDPKPSALPAAAGPADEAAAAPLAKARMPALFRRELTHGRQSSASDPGPAP